MSFPLYVLLSSLECAVVLVLIFTLFRIHMGGYAVQIGFTSFMLSTLSYSLRGGELESFAPLFNIIVMMFFIWLLFHVHIYYASIITVVGYVIYAILQMLIYLIVNSIGLVDSDELQQSTLEGYWVPVLTMIVTLIICFCLRKFDWTFDWIPDGNRVNLEKEKSILSIALLIIIVAFMEIAFSLIFSDQSFAFFVIYGILVLVFIYLLYLSYKRNWSE